MREVGQQYPICGYGNTFFEWIFCTNPKPYNSFGNGSAMRVSYVGEYYETLDEVISNAEKTAAVSHNHPEGIKKAVTTAVCIQIGLRYGYFVCYWWRRGRRILWWNGI